MAITLANSNVATSTSATTLAAPIRISSQSERFLLVVVSHRDRTAGASTVSWWPSGVSDGTSQALTFMGRRAHGSSQMMIEFWGLLAPTGFSATSARVSVTYAASHGSVTVLPILLSGVDQTTPYAGYPGTATSLTTAQGATTASTSTLTVPTPNGNEMVIVADQFSIASLTNPTYIPVSGQQYLGHKVAGSSGAYMHTGAQLKTATGATTGALATISGTSSTYIIAALALNASTSIAPRWVAPPVTSAPNNISFASGTVNAISTAEFNATNTPGIQVGRFMFGVASQLATYTGVTATSFTGVAGANGGSTAATTGERIQESSGWGGSSAATLNIVLPSTAAVNDIAIVSLYTADDTGDPTSGGKFTLITSNSVAGAGGRPNFRHCTYYRRLVAGDLTNEAARVTTFSNVTGAAIISAQVMIYRGCNTSGSPVDASASADISAPTASSLLTAPDVTTTTADTVLVTIFAQNVASTAGLEGSGAGIFARKGLWWQHVVGDAEWRAAGAVTTGNRTWTSGVICEASTVTIALKQIGNVTLDRTATVLSGAAPTRGLARISAYERPVTSVTTLGLTLAGLRVYARAASSTIAAMSLTVGRVRVLARGMAIILTRTHALVRRVTYARTINTVNNTITNTIAAAVIHVVGTVYNRTLSVVQGTGVSRTVLRVFTARRGIVRTGTITLLGTRVPIYRRGVARTGSITLLPKKVGSTYRRHPTRTGAITLAVNYTKQGAGLSFYDYGTPNAPVIKTIDKALYPGFALYMEAQFASSDVNQSAQCHLYDVTALSVVAGSTLITTAPHDVQRIYRSADISGNLTSGHTYKVRFGRTSGYFVKPIWAELAGETT